MFSSGREPSERELSYPLFEEILAAMDKYIISGKMFIQKVNIRMVNIMKCFIQMFLRIPVIFSRCPCLSGEGFLVAENHGFIKWRLCFLNG